jgi:hypothetical protein
MFINSLPDWKYLKRDTLFRDGSENLISHLHSHFRPIPSNHITFFCAIASLFPNELPFVHSHRNFSAFSFYRNIVSLLIQQQLTKRALFSLSHAKLREMRRKRNAKTISKFASLNTMSFLSAFSHRITTPALFDDVNHRLGQWTINRKMAYFSSLRGDKFATPSSKQQ